MAGSRSPLAVQPSSFGATESPVCDLAPLGGAEESSPCSGVEPGTMGAMELCSVRAQAALGAGAARVLSSLTRRPASKRFRTLDCHSDTRNDPCLSITWMDTDGYMKGIWTRQSGLRYATLHKGRSPVRHGEPNPHENTSISCTFRFRCV
jgi:hypothetical protein